MQRLVTVNTFPQIFEGETTFRLTVTVTRETVVGKSIKDRVGIGNGNCRRLEAEQKGEEEEYEQRWLYKNSRTIADRVQSDLMRSEIGGGEDWQDADDAPSRG